MLAQTCFGARVVAILPAGMKIREEGGIPRSIEILNAESDVNGSRITRNFKIK